MASSLPRVRLIATGGSIAGVGPHRLDYILYPGHISIEESLARVPEVKEIAEVQAENLISVGSTAVGPPEWLAMADRINQIFREDTEVTGVAMTHGTATLEETAYFLWAPTAWITSSTPSWVSTSASRSPWPVCPRSRRSPRCRPRT